MNHLFKCYAWSYTKMLSYIVEFNNLFSCVCLFETRISKYFFIHSCLCLKSHIFTPLQSKLFVFMIRNFNIFVLSKHSSFLRFTIHKNDVWLDFFPSPPVVWNMLEFAHLNKSVLPISGIASQLAGSLSSSDRDT